jgi:myosin-15
LEKIHNLFGENPKYERPKLSKTCFGIRHYAGVVNYEVQGFLDKNKDSLPPDILAVLGRSNNSLVKSLLHHNI